MNLEAHVKNVQKFGVPVVVALNRFTSDTQEEIDAVLQAAKGWGARAALSDVWAKGGEGGEAVAQGGARAARREARRRSSRSTTSAQPIKAKIETIAKEIYGADGVDYTRRGGEEHRPVRGHGPGPDAGLHGQDPVLLQRRRRPSSGRPTGFRLTIRDVYPSAGAGFVVALAGDIMTMPGLSKTPSAEAIRVHPDGTIEGLF